MMRFERLNDSSAMMGSQWGGLVATDFIIGSIIAELGGLN